MGGLGPKIVFRRIKSKKIEHLEFFSLEFECWKHWRPRQDFNLGTRPVNLGRSP